MVSRGKTERQAARNERLAAALRENLKRRKAQTRGRASGRAGGAASDETAQPATGSAAAKTPDFRRNPERD
jgi:hypothetical protein